MMDFDPETFGELNAADYDAYHDPGTTAESVDFIAEIAGQGRILELAIGTGRMALPLAARGFDVSGIEGSSEMVRLMHEKPGGKDIPVVIGDYADVAIDGPFGHVFLVFNTLFNLTTQAAQVRCFRNVTDRLSSGGTFLVEMVVPDVARFRAHQDVRMKQIDMTSVWLEAVKHDPVHQRMEFQRIRFVDGAVKLVPFAMRYVWPSELDLMAALAGLTLRERWGGWHREPFTADSKMHVSVYEKA